MVNSRGTATVGSRSMPASTEFDFPNAATPPGSAAYYVVRFAPEQDRHDLARLYAWRAELRHIVERANDPGVARLKLDWWRAELERGAAGEARHPLARALSGLLQRMAGLDPFGQMLDTAEQEIRRLQPETEDQLLQRLARSGGAFAELSLLRAENPGIEPETRERARRLGSYDAAVEMLRDLYPALQRAYCPLPLAAMAEHRLRADRLGEEAQQRGLGRYSRELLERLDIGGELRAASARRRPELLPARRSAALSAALHRKLARRDYPVMRQRIELSPIENLWIAWRLR